MKRAVVLALLVTALCGGCAAKLGVEFDEGEDFASYESWAWLERKRAAIKLEGVPPDGLQDLIEREVERALGERGYVRAGEGDEPDFFVTYHARVEREVELGTVETASRYVASMHSTPSYVVSAPERTFQIYDRSLLVMDVAEGRDRQLVWRGRWDMRVRGEFRGQVPRAVDRILGRFPPPLDD